VKDERARLVAEDLKDLPADHGRSMSVVPCAAWPRQWRTAGHQAAARRRCSVNGQARAAVSAR
jgi:hypothetical protein